MKKTTIRYVKTLTLLLGVSVLPLSMCQVSAQTITNAYDAGINYSTGTYGPGNGLGANGNGVNLGFGFGAWTFTVPPTIPGISSAGAFINNNGPSGQSFDLWNQEAGNATVASRTFGSALSVGESFSLSMRNNGLDGGSSTSNMMVLEDSSGNALFSYWHIGGDNTDAHYSDGTVANGTAANFPYAFTSFNSFTFTLNSPTTYTFTDNSTGSSISGTISGTVDQVAFLRGDASSWVNDNNGQDFQFDQLAITVPEPTTIALVGAGMSLLLVMRRRKA